MGRVAGDNEIAIKDAYMEFRGFKQLKIAPGNKTFPFSRENITYRMGKNLNGASNNDEDQLFVQAQYVF